MYGYLFVVGLYGGGDVGVLVVFGGGLVVFGVGFLVVVGCFVVVLDGD